jgi:hypothetical protein
VSPKAAPAEKAGMKAGDVIVQFGTTTVTNIYDYMYALESAKIGVETDVVVERDGARISLKLTPSERPVTAQHGHQNRLAKETSPYLRQHAGNPVGLVFRGGRKHSSSHAHSTKPIFLSIGYSACHWCHVMEHESFENPEIAELLNSLFVNIKVDREERPDIDAIYMQAVPIHERWAGAAGR